MVILAALIFLMLCAPANAGQSLRICILGDIQFAVKCNEPDTAIDALTASVDEIVANPDRCDVVLLPGDLTEHFPAFNPEDDCECLAQDPAHAACSTVTSWWKTDGCDDCSDAQAMACKGGTAGRYCEWTRARNIVDTIEAAGIPVAWVSGNHDQAMVPSDIQPGQFDVVWQEFRQFFGEGKLSQLFKESGSYTYGPNNYPRVLNGDSPTGGEFSSYHVLEAAGSEWLIVGIGHVKIGGGVDDPGTAENFASMSAMLSWAQGVIEAHPGLPTIIMSHWLWNETEEWDVSGKDDFYQQVDPALNKYPQVFLNVSGHFGNPGTASQSGAGHKVAASGYKIVGMVHDFSYDAEAGTGLPSWVLQANGGGGVVGYVRVDPRAGLISQYAHSPEEEERVTISGGDGTSVTDWREQIHMCGSPRFTLGTSTCTGPPRPCNGCWSEIR